MKLLRVTKKIVYFITDLCLVNVTLSPFFLGGIFKITWRKFEIRYLNLPKSSFSIARMGLGSSELGCLLTQTI